MTIPSEIIQVCDLPDPNNPGKTFRQVNWGKTHCIPIGSLVELISEDNHAPWSGCRLYVVHHVRDCDGEPLYELSADKTDTTRHREGWRNPSWFGPFGLDSLSVIELA